MVLEDNHTTEVARILDVSKEVLNEIVNGNSRIRLSSFKGDTLKEVLRYLKNAGCTSSKLSLSKDQLVAIIETILKGDSVDDYVRQAVRHIAVVQPTMAAPIRSSLSVVSVVNTIRKREVYSELINIPGISQQEVLSVMSTCEDPDPDADTLLFQIISKRQAVEEQHEANEKALQVQENADVDRAIAESEHERDVIQRRKRARVQELRDDPLCLISQADEYKASVLLSKGPSLSSSSTSSSSFVGSSALRNLVLLIDSTFSSTISYDVSTCSSGNGQASSGSKLDVDAILKARKSVTDLLLLEIDAVKYHKKASIPYLCGLSLYLDNKLTSLPPLPESTELYCALLDTQAARLQRALYTLPTEGHLVPLLFRMAFADPKLSSSVFSSSIDEDGFEMVKADDTTAATTTANVAGTSSSSNGSELADSDLFMKLYEIDNEPRGNDEDDDSSDLEDDDDE